jgi:hypothetical protein
LAGLLLGDSHASSRRMENPMPPIDPIIAEDELPAEAE